MEMSPSVSEAMNFPCYDFGENCSLFTKESCLKAESCGWCNKDGQGKEFNNGKTTPGTGCTPLRRGTSSSLKQLPYCGDCEEMFFITELPAQSKKLGHYVQEHPGEFSAIVFVIIFVIVGLLIIGFRCYKAEQKKKSNVIDSSSVESSPTNPTQLA